MYTTETRTFPKGIKEIRVFDDNISLRFTSRDRTGYITLNNVTGKFDIIPGIGVDAPVTSVNTMTGDVVITAADLNAALVGHTHLKADITDFAHTHTKEDIADFGHTHTKSQITDLGAILPEAPLDGKQYARKNANWEEVTSTAPSTGTNLSITRTSSSVVVLSDTGTDASIPSATTSLAGVMTSLDKLRVDNAVQNINAVDGGISLVHIRTGDTWNIKSLQAGANITLSEYAGVVTITGTGSSSQDSKLTSNREVTKSLSSTWESFTSFVNSDVPKDLNGFSLIIKLATGVHDIISDSPFIGFKNGNIIILPETSNGVPGENKNSTLRIVSSNSLRFFNLVNVNIRLDNIKIQHSSNVSSPLLHVTSNSVNVNISSRQCSYDCTSSTTSKGNVFSISGQYGRSGNSIYSAEDCFKECGTIITDGNNTTYQTGILNVRTINNIYAGTYGVTRIAQGYGIQLLHTGPQFWSIAETDSTAVKLATA